MSSPRRTHQTDLRQGAAPPGAAIWLLDHALDDAEGETLLGDLLEEHAARSQRGESAARLRLWFWKEAIAAVTVARPRRDELRHYTGDAPVRRFLDDLRHGVRLLRRAPVFTAVCALTLALGIGATTAIFSIVYPVLVEPLPYPDPGRVMLVFENDEEGERVYTSFATFTDLARESRTLSHAAAVGTWAPTVTEGGEPERLAGLRVSSSYFDVLGVRPMLGSGFRAEHDDPAGERVIILAHGIWRGRFGADSGIIGRAVALDGTPHLVVGVMPAGFDNVLAAETQVWRPLRYDASQPWACRTCRHLRMLVRVRPDVDPGAARQELDALSAALVAEHPRDYPAAGIHLVSLKEQVTSNARPMLLVLVAAVALLLLLAAANVANLQLTRAMRREHEFAIRAALGAGRSRLAQQLLAEGLLLALLGLVGGLLVARTALPMLLARMPERLPRLDAVRIDLTALTVAAVLTAALGLAIGLLPALHGGRATVFGALREGARAIGTRRRLARAALVSAEVALALVLLAGAGLLGRSLSALLDTNPGFDPSGLLALEVQATGAAYATAADVYANHDRIREAVAAIPGVSSVGLTNQLPLGGNRDSYGIRAQDRPLDNPALAPSGDRYVVSPDFMRTMRIPVVRGRAFAAADFDSAAPPVAMLSGALAERLWGGADAIGKRVQLGGPDTPWREVVGIAGNVRHASLDSDITQQIWIPERQWQWADAFVTLVVRTEGDAGALASTVRQALRRVDPAQPITRVATMEQIVASTTAQRRLALVLFAAFSITALLMAAAGIYGVLAGSVIERTREIGVRTALGAPPRRIVALVLGQGARLVAAGVLIGLAGALVLGRVLGGLLYEIAPGDPATLATVTLLLLGIALLACLVPVRRALRVDPVTAIRTE